MADQRREYHVPLGDRGSTIMLLTEDHQKRSYPNAKPVGSGPGEKAAEQPHNKAAPLPDNKAGQ